MSNLRELLTSTADRIVDFRESLAERRVGPVADLERLRGKLGGPLSAEGTDAGTVLDELAAAVEPALMSSAGPRFFGFVVGDRSTPRSARTSSRAAGTRWRSTARRRRPPRWSRKSRARG